ncbi:MAG: VWA domain-containing protein [Anaerolineae bacterium]|nr:VWA domain-containing protein [Anaerolineae bacterium]
MTSEADYYAVLGIGKSAKDQEIEEAYRALRDSLQPEVAEGGAPEQLQRLQEAYEVLSDPKKRAAYDRWRAQEDLAGEPAINLQVVLSHSNLSCLDEDQALYALLEITPSPHIEVRRLPLNLCLVLDRSTSMQGLRLQRVKEATHYIIDYLDDDDILSLVTFSDRAEVVLSGERLVDRARVKAQVSAIRSSGGTEIFQGLQAGLRELERARGSDTVNHLILLTDGQTYGDEDKCLLAADRASRHQIGISTMGIGQDWNDKLLDEIAQRSGGTSAYIDSAAKVTSFFRDKVHSLVNVFARELRYTLTLGEGISLKDSFRVSPYIARLQEREGGFHLGQLTTDEPMVILLEFLIAPRPPGRHRLFQLELVGDVPVLGRQSERIKREVDVRFAPTRELEETVPPRIVSALGKLAIFKMQEKTLDDLERGEVEQASQRLETMATRLLNIGELELAKSALLEAGRLARTGHLSPEGRKKIRYGTRSLSLLPKEVTRD